MTQHPAPALAGLLRVVFFLAVAVVGVTAVVIGVTTIYDAPSGVQGEFEVFGFEEDQERANYNRNLGLVFGFIGIGAIAVGILGLGSRFNPLRAGLLGGGAGLVLAGVGVGSGGSDDWLTFVTSGLALLTLVACSPWLDEGLPLERVTRGEPPASEPGAGLGGAGEGPAPG